MKLSSKQGFAVDQVAAWFKANDRPVFRLFGYAGTGKTSIARFFADLINGKVMYMAFTGKASMVMRKNGCAGASTIHSSIYKVKVDSDTGQTKFRVRPRIEFDGVKLIIIDECSMVDEWLGADLLSLGIPILVLGDPGQLPPVSGGGFFTSADPDVMLEEIHRQAADNPIVRLATDVREGRGISVGNHGAAKVITRDDVTPALVMGADQVLVGSNRTRANYNRRLRQLLGFDHPMPMKGERLVALKNQHDMGILNGGLWEIVDLKRKRGGSVANNCLNMAVKSLDFDAAAIDVKVRREMFTGQGKEVPWRELRGTQQFDYGYTLTVHKSQGSQWSNVCLFDESAAFGADRNRHLYTGITRASEQLTIII